MKIKLLATLVAFLSVITCHAQASRTQDGIFIRPAYGLMSSGLTLHGGSLAVGSRTDNAEGSVEVGYYKGAVDSVDINIVPILGNFRYYIPLGSDKLQFHVGASVGGTIVNLNGSVVYEGYTYTGSGSLGFLTAGVGAGLTYNITEKLALDAEYRYLVNWNSANSFSYGAGLFSGGLSYTF